MEQPRVGTLRVPYQVGIFARAQLATVLAYGRSLGIQVMDHQGGGWLIRAGYITATGDEPSIHRFAQRLSALGLAAEQATD